MDWKGGRLGGRKEGRRGFLLLMPISSEPGFTGFTDLHDQPPVDTQTPLYPDALLVDRYSETQHTYAFEKNNVGFHSDLQVFTGSLDFQGASLCRRSRRHSFYPTYSVRGVFSQFY